MSEDYLGVIEQVVMAPDFDSVYDIVLTSKRMILVYLEKNTGFSEVPFGHAKDYLDVDPQQLAAKADSIAISCENVQKVETSPSEGLGTFFVIVTYLDSNGKRTKLKLELFGQVDTTVCTFRKDDSAGPSKQKVFAPEGEARLLLSKAFPYEVFRFPD